MTTVRTARLILETLTVSEARAIADGDRAGRDWALDYPTDGDVLVASIALEAGPAYDESAPLGVLQVRLAESGLAVGGIGFLHAPDTDGEVEVGYGLASSAQGQGLATEALQGVMALARSHEVRRIAATTSPENGASHRVLVRCGFSRDGVVDGGDEGELWRWVRDLGD